MHRILNKYNWLIILTLLVSCSKKVEIANEQADYFVKYFGGSASDKAIDMVPCTDGGYALTGTMSAGTNIKQAFFIKTDKFGNAVGSSPFIVGDGNLSQGNSICQTNDGGFLIVGFVVPSGRSDKDVLIVKLTPEGVISWTQKFGGAKDDEGLSVVEVSSGNILIGGYTESYGNGGKDAWGILLDGGSGDKKWDRTYGFAGNEVCNSFIEKDDYFLLVGYTESYLYSTLKRSVLLVKVNKSSGINFDNEYYGGANNESGIKAFKDISGYIYVLANSVAPSGLSNVYLLKLNDNFHMLIWEKYLTSSRNEIGNDIVLQNNHLVVVGSSATSQNTDFLIDVLDANGELLNTDANTISVGGDQGAQACFVGIDGKVVFAGWNNVMGFSKISLIKTDLPK